MGTRVVIAALVAVCFVAAGCTSPDVVAPRTSAPQTPGQTTESAPVTETETQVAPAQEGSKGPSEDALDYARELGGVSQSGGELHFIIGASCDSEKAAQSLLDKAIPLFGDMQSYFVVQRSDNFDGMRPGYWVVIEAYEKRPSEENLQFARRGFPKAYVKQATVLTADPLPVYEQLVGE